MKKQTIKKGKLSIEKFTISKLNGMSKINGGLNGETDDATDDPDKPKCEQGSLVLAP